MDSPLSNKYLINIVGPTASGKTALSIELAQYFSATIINFDSRQFYKEMKIGTAFPTTEELNSAPHLLMGSKSIHEDFNSGKFESEALKLIEKLHQSDDVVITVGGSGLYLKALLEGFDDLPKVDSSLRPFLQKEFESKGLVYLQNLLFQKDPVTFKTIDINNHTRLIRALEICIGTGKPYSNFKSNSKKERPFKWLNLGLEWERELLYERINKRVDIMMKEGLLDEVKSLASFQHLNALKTVGYSELFQYLDGNCSLEEAIELVKRNSRRYAKKQMTWFRNQMEVQWFTIAETAKIIESVESQLI